MHCSPLFIVYIISIALLIIVTQTNDSQPVISSTGHISKILPSCGSLKQRRFYILLLYCAPTRRTLYLLPAQYIVHFTMEYISFLFCSLMSDNTYSVFEQILFSSINRIKSNDISRFTDDHLNAFLRIIAVMTEINSHHCPTKFIHSRFHIKLYILPFAFYGFFFNIFF